MMGFLRKDKGFTLLEIMLVVIIIGIIAIIALPRLLITKEVAEDRSCDSNVQAIRTQLEQFHWNRAHWPGDLEDFMTLADYNMYWPESSAVSSNCPAGAGYYSYSSSNGRIMCSLHSGTSQAPE